MVGISFGATADPLEKQLYDQGYALKFDDLRKCQRIADAIEMLNLHNYIQDGVAHKCRSRLAKEIGKNLHGVNE